MGSTNTRIDLISNVTLVYQKMYSPDRLMFQRLVDFQQQKNIHEIRDLFMHTIYRILRTNCVRAHVWLTTSLMPCFYHHLLELSRIFFVKFR